MNPNKKCIRPLGINVIANLNINIAIKRNMNIPHFLTTTRTAR